MPQRIQDNRVLITTTEACEMAGVTSAYIQRLLRDGRIEGVKLGRDWLIYEDSLNAFLSHPRKRGRPHKETTQDNLVDTSLHIGHARGSEHGEEGQEVTGNKET